MTKKQRYVISVGLCIDVETSSTKEAKRIVNKALEKTLLYLAKQDKRIKYIGDLDTAIAFTIPTEK